MAQTTVSPSGAQHVEFFTGPTKAAVHAAMDQRLGALAREGHQFVKRQSVGRNPTCPCGSGRKFKKCCLSKAMGTA